jgi:hypothetical protein
VRDRRQEIQADIRNLRFNPPAVAAGKDDVHDGPDLNRRRPLAFPSHDAARRNTLAQSKGRVLPSCSGDRTEKRPPSLRYSHRREEAVMPSAPKGSRSVAHFTRLVESLERGQHPPREPGRLAAATALLNEIFAAPWETPEEREQAQGLVARLKRLRAKEAAAPGSDGRV